MTRAHSRTRAVSQAARARRRHHNRNAKMITPALTVVAAKAKPKWLFCFGAAKNSQ